ncbi:MAG: DUF4846 domain-containing protein [Deltaproteobacteria bacterium]|nr:DUF4846 domain-containing protein [Deltaproteobacteria bacterium]MBN2671917.1 DUF4846 domain-containing protein [Deltaproteobacteria bacterium]
MHRQFLIILVLLSCGVSAIVSGNTQHPVFPTYRWQYGERGQSLADRISPPDGYTRVSVSQNSFARWLRFIPLKPDGSPVRLFNGKLKCNQDVHAAVIDIDVGTRDRQQCADAVMRLRAEYLYSAGKAQSVCFRAASNKQLCYRDYHKVGFRRYLSNVFAFANTASLYHMLKPVSSRQALQAGDVFIEPAQKGAYGHAVMVMDVAENARGERVFLLAQSYMPAQDIHLLKNPSEPRLGPWYRYHSNASLVTPEWRFESGSLRRF